MDKPKETRKRSKKLRKPYQKPEIFSEEIKENIAVLACGKCESGPISQYACQRFPTS